MTSHTISRRTFLAFSATLPFAWRARAASSIPVGLELYSVRKELQRDPQATVRAVAKMGYQCVEFYAAYFQWSEDETKQLRKLLDVTFPVDVGTCVQAYADPVAWLRGAPGRFRSLHCNDWAPDPAKGYSVLFGEGKADRTAILVAAETVGGAEYSLIEQ